MTFLLYTALALLAMLAIGIAVGLWAGKRMAAAEIARSIGESL